jgi:hypothetical protein
MSPLVAQSGLTEASIHLSTFGGKADIHGSHSQNHLSHDPAKSPQEDLNRQQKRNPVALERSHASAGGHEPQQQ